MVLCGTEAETGAARPGLGCGVWLPLTPTLTLSLTLTLALTLTWLPGGPGAAAVERAVHAEVEPAGGVAGVAQKEAALRVR